MCHLPVQGSKVQLGVLLPPSEVNILPSNLLCDLLTCEWEGRDGEHRHLLKDEADKVNMELDQHKCKLLTAKCKVIKPSK